MYSSGGIGEGGSTRGQPPFYLIGMLGLFWWAGKQIGPKENKKGGLG